MSKRTIGGTGELPSFRLDATAFKAGLRKAMGVVRKFRKALERRTQKPLDGKVQNANCEASDTATKKSDSHERIIGKAHE